MLMSEGILVYYATTFIGAIVQIAYHAMLAALTGEAHLAQTYQAALHHRYL